MLAISQSSIAGSLDCTIKKGISGASLDLVQTVFAYEDSEEETESYSVLFRDKVEAAVEYAPYQNGVDLILKLLKSGITARANYDQMSDEYMDLSITDTRGLTYYLECRR